MAPSKELTALLFELERASSPLERLQIIARSWRSVRSLDGFERRDLARRIGLDGGEELLERLATKGGVAPAALLEALRRARRADPAQLRGILAGLRSPGDRERAVLEGLHVAESMLAPEEEESSESGDERGDEPLPASEPSAAGPEPEPEPAETAEAPPPMPPVPAAPPRVAPPAPPPVAGAPRPPFRLPPERPARPAPPIPPAPQPTLARPARPEPPLEPSASLPAATPLETPPAATAREPAMRSLRHLEGRLAAATEADLEELATVALGMPDGWVRRRAVLALLRHGIATRAADALRLVEGLGSDRDRRWALAALLDDRTLAAGELEQALALIDSEPARRRLRRRTACRRGEGSRVKSQA